MQVLYADLDKLNALTKRIQGSLARLETSGKVVKDAIGPIYGNTQSLQTTNVNIDKVNEAIDRLRKPLDVKGKEESIIRQGYITLMLKVSQGERKLTEWQTSKCRPTAVSGSPESGGTGSGRPEHHQSSLEPESCFRIQRASQHWEQQITRSLPLRSAGG